MENWCCLVKAVLFRDNIASRDFGVVRYNITVLLDKSFLVMEKQCRISTNDDAVARAAFNKKDGKLVIVGSSAPLSGGNRDFAIARYLANGSLDGAVLAAVEKCERISQAQNDVATGVIQQWDGKLLVAGNSSNGDGVLVRYNTNGTLDSSFGAGGI